MPSDDETLDSLLQEGARLVPELRAHLPICALLIDHEIRVATERTKRSIDRAEGKLVPSPSKPRPDRTELLKSSSAKHSSNTNNSSFHGLGSFKRAKEYVKHVGGGLERMTEMLGITHHHEAPSPKKEKPSSPTKEKPSEPSHVSTAHARWHADRAAAQAAEAGAAVEGGAANNSGGGDDDDADAGPAYCITEDAIARAAQSARDLAPAVENLFGVNDAWRDMQAKVFGQAGVHVIFAAAKLRRKSTSSKNRLLTPETAAAAGLAAASGGKSLAAPKSLAPVTTRPSHIPMVESKAAPSGGSASFTAASKLKKELSLGARARVAGASFSGPSPGRRVHIDAPPPVANEPVAAAAEPAAPAMPDVNEPPLDALARKKQALARYSYYAELVGEGEHQAAERVAMGAEDAAAAVAREVAHKRMHLLVAEEARCVGVLGILVFCGSCGSCGSCCSMVFFFVLFCACASHVILRACPLRFAPGVARPLNSYVLRSRPGLLLERRRRETERRGRAAAAAGHRRERKEPPQEVRPRVDPRRCGRRVRRRRCSAELEAGDAGAPPARARLWQPRRHAVYRRAAPEPARHVQ